MSSRASSARGLLKWGVAAILFAISCNGGGGGCGGGGCGGCGPGAYQFPLNDPNRPDAILQTEAARVRITQNFLDFIRPQLPDLIRGQLGSSGGMRVDADGVLHIPIPNVDLFDIGVAEARLRQGEVLLWLSDLEQRMDLRFETPNNVRLTLTNLRLGVSLRLKEDFAGSTSSCPVQGDLGPLGPGPLRHAAEVSINTVIDPGVGPDPDRNLDVRVTVDDVALNDLDLEVAGSNVYCGEPECQDCAVEVFGSCLDPGGRCVECDIFCGGITDGLLSLVGALIDLVKPILNRLLKPIVENALANALNGLNGSSAKFQAQIDLGETLGVPALSRANPFGTLVAPEPGRFPVVDRGRGNGMEITLSGGAEANLADCVGSLADFVPVKGPVPVLGGMDSRGRAYHLGATFASSMINQILYAVHRSGTLCLKLTTEDVRALSGGRFTLNAALLSLLAADITKLATDAAPVILELKPRNAATISLGTGQKTGVDAMGKDIYDWLLKLSLQDLGIAFHVLMHDRYVRIFEVTTDIFVGLNINILPDNKLEVAVGELRIDDFHEVFNELVQNANFAMVLPTLIEIAMQGLLTNQLTFDVDITDAVSRALNGAPIYMRVNDIFRDGVQQDFLTLSLTFTATPTTNLSLAADTRAELDGDGGLVRRDTPKALPSGRVRLKVGQGLGYATEQALEYQVRVDQGVWRVAQSAQPDGTLWAEDAHLFLPGRHEIEVRARYQDDYQSLDPAWVRLVAVVDPNPPELSARLLEDGVHVRITDRESLEGEAAELFVAQDDGAPRTVMLEAAVAADGAVSWETTLPFAALTGSRRLTLSAADPRGNTSGVATLRLGLAAEGDSTTEENGCSCHEVGFAHAHSEASAALFALFAALLYLARHRARR